MVLDEDGLPPVRRVLPVPQSGQAVTVHVGRDGDASEGLAGLELHGHAHRQPGAVASHSLALRLGLEAELCSASATHGVISLFLLRMNASIAGRGPGNTRQLMVLLRLSGAAARLRICPGPAVLLA